MTCEISVCDDIDYINSVIFDPEMWERCKDDQTDPNIDLSKSLWLVASKNGERVGICSVFDESGCCLDIHINIPKKHRGRGTLAIGRAMIGWIKNHNISGKSKLVTQIPVIYRDVIQFALRLGFKKEGVNRQSVIIGGAAIDKLYMGITFGEINE